MNADIQDFHFILPDTASISPTLFSKQNAKAQRKRKKKKRERDRKREKEREEVRSFKKIERQNQQRL